MSDVLKAPFQWFGGKSRVAALVWDRFGDVPNFVEPFAGSLAVLLARPHEPKTETVNDKDAYLSNFWRAIRFDPIETAKWADWPVSEADLLARHRWLVSTGAERIERIKTDPHFCDPKVAGWWVWGLCSWIGSGWCRQRGDGDQPEQIPHLGNAGMGINRKLPHLGDAGRGEKIQQYFEALSARLRDVRICCGGWDRVLSPAVTTHHGITGVFLDPPYTEGDLQYSAGGCGGNVASAVREWAISNGGDGQLRIALCGYEGEHDIPDSWECVKWKARKGYQATGANQPTRWRCSMTQSFLTTSLDVLKQKAKDLEIILRDREGIAVEHETDPLDEAIGAATRDVAVQSIEAARKQLRHVYAALKRIAVGTYGFCETCGSPIPDKRLTAVPWAAECLECAVRREGREERPGPMATYSRRVDVIVTSPFHLKQRAEQNLRSSYRGGARY